MLFAGAPNRAPPLGALETIPSIGLDGLSDLLGEVRGRRSDSRSYCAGTEPVKFIGASRVSSLSASSIFNRTALSLAMPSSS
jgi:hypothetical protein